MAFLNKIRKNKIGVQKSSNVKTEKSKKLFNFSLKKIISKPSNKTICKKTNKKIRHNTKPCEKERIYSKDDLITAIPSQECINARSRSHSISYDFRPTFNSTLTPDKRTQSPVKNINIKVNTFWGEEYKKEQFNLSISRTSSYDSLKKAISEKLGGSKLPHDFAILYHTRRYHKNNSMRRILLDYWIKNK